jgi:hypothetical protein
MTETRCKTCHTEYHGPDAELDMEEHEKFCRCWHCFRFGGGDTGRLGSCSGCVGGCTDWKPHRMELVRTRRIEKAWLKERERIARMPVDLTIEEEGE